MSGNTSLPWFKRSFRWVCILQPLINLSVSFLDFTFPLKIDEQSRALDLNGLRYLISLRFYVLWRQRSPASGSLTPASHESPRSLTHQHERISFRNVVWALHSESQEILLAEATSASSKGKMLWQDAKALGVFLWMRSAETLVSP